MKCPHCQNEIEAPELWEFFDCTSCGASLQLEDDKLKILKKPGENTSTNSEIQQNIEENSKPSIEELASKNFEDFSESPSITPSSNIPNPDKISSDESMNTPTSPSEEASSNNHRDQPTRASNPLPTESVESSPSFEESDNLSNILDFESFSNQKNHFIYHLQISEVSSKFLFNKVCHILKNPRVKLDCPNQEENNTLVIKNLNAVQMAYLLRKLSPLSVGIHWQQKSTLTE